MELFLIFYDILGDDLLRVMEESHLQGRIHGPFNSTFIALISKDDSPTSFDDFRPISLCNGVYKIIVKAIAKIFKKILSKVISSKQFVFL